MLASSAVSNTRFVGCAQPVRANQLEALLRAWATSCSTAARQWPARPAPALLDACYVVDRVSHGLIPLGFQTSQFRR